jgi:cytochrome P450
MSPDLSSQIFKRDPIPSYLALLETGKPVEIKHRWAGPIRMFTRHPDVVALLKQDDLFASDPHASGRRRTGDIKWLPKRMRALSHHVASFDGDEHRHVRSLALPAFRPPRIEELQQAIASIVDEILEKLPLGQNVDLVSAFSRPVATSMIALALGLPVSDVPRLMSWTKPFSRRFGLIGLTSIVPNIYGLSGHLAHRSAAPTQAPLGLIEALTMAHREGMLSDDKLIANLFLFAVVGQETTGEAIASGALSLIQHPEQRAVLLASEDRANAHVDEILRYCSVGYISNIRYATTDCEIGGVAIARGEKLLGLIGSANADPSVFSQPARLDLTRDASGQLQFSRGPHFCIGAHLARATIGLALIKLFRRFDEIQLSHSAADVSWTTKFGVRGPTKLLVRLRGRPRS